MDKENKVRWHKPELIVLVRSKPQESVLAACKAGEGSGTSNTGYTQATCEPDTQCNICSTVDAS